MSKEFILTMGDTDGLKFCKPNMEPFSKEEINKLIDEMNNKLPNLIQLEFDGYFENIAIIKTKNYITNQSGKVKFKGSSLKDPKREVALLEMIQDIGNSVLFGINYDELLEIYHEYIQEAINVQNISRWCTKKTLTKAILDCKTNPDARANESKVWDAIKDKELQEGDKFHVYTSQDGMKPKKVKGEIQYLKDGTIKMEPNYILKSIDDYSNDTVPVKLLERVFKTMKIFETIIDIKQFPNYSLKSNKSKLDKLQEI